MNLKLLFLLLVALTAFGTIGCQYDQSSSTQDVVQVVVSIPPQQEMVNEIGGKQVVVKSILPPGASPATYSPTAQDIRAVQDADMYIAIGLLPFEQVHLSTFVEYNNDLVIINISQVVKLRYFTDKHDHEDTSSHQQDQYPLDERHIDPHIWLSPRQQQKQIPLITNHLSQQLPQYKTSFEQRAKKYNVSLQQLDAYIVDQLKNRSSSMFLVFHPSWGYFARDYNLTQFAIEQDGKDPSPQQLQNVIDFARQQQVSAIIVQEQFSTKAAQSISQELSIPLLHLNPLAKNYSASLKEIAAAFAKELR